MLTVSAGWKKLPAVPLPALTTGTQRNEGLTMQQFCRSYVLCLVFVRRGQGLWQNAQIQQTLEKSKKKKKMTQRTETKEELAKSDLRSKKNMSWWNIHKIIEQPNTLVAKQATTYWNMKGPLDENQRDFVRKSDSMVNVNVYGLV